MPPVALPDLLPPFSPTQVALTLSIHHIVSGGDVVGGMGNTGYTVGESGVHLDLKVKSDGRWVDPLIYFE